MTQNRKAAVGYLIFKQEFSQTANRLQNSKQMNKKTGTFFSHERNTDSKN
jgi:hypothetical protein